MNYPTPRSTVITSTVLGAAVLSLGLATACSPSERAEVRAETNQAAKTTELAIDDAGLTAKVKAALLADSNVQGMAINVDTNAGVVTLTGTVPAAQAQQAEQLAAKVEGVRSIRNNLTTN